MEKRTFTKEQNNYMVAKANYQVALEQLRNLQILHGVDELYDIDFDKAFELDEALSEQVGHQNAYDLMSQTESELVEWGFSQAELQELYTKNLRDLEFLRNEARMNLVTREKVATLVMRLAV